MATVLAVIVFCLLFIGVLLLAYTDAGRDLRIKALELDSNPLRHHRSDQLVRLAFILMGPVALTCLTFTFIEAIPGPDLIFTVALPVYILGTILGFLFPRTGVKAWAGFLAGIAATLTYDVVRLLTTYAAGLPDFVPHMGELMTANANAEPWVGYVWRIFGNGAGLAVVYAMLPPWWRSMKGSLIYSEILNFALLGVLIIFPVAQLHLVNLTLQAAINSVLGHWAYGLTLFWAYPRLLAKLTSKPGKHMLDG